MSSASGSEAMLRRRIRVHGNVCGTATEGRCLQDLAKNMLTAKFEALLPTCQLQLTTNQFFISANLVAIPVPVDIVLFRGERCFGVWWLLLSHTDMDMDRSMKVGSHHTR